MSMYIVLVVLCLVIIGVLMINIGVVSKKEQLLLRWVCVGLFAFSMTRYLTLIVYGGQPTLQQLETLRYFYLASSIGLTIPLASAVWWLTPYLRERIKYPSYLALFTPFMAFYLFVLITQPTEIMKSESFGYTLELTGRFPLYLSIVQGTFVTLMITLCTLGFLKYKNTYLRSQYMILILALIVLTLDGLGYFIPSLDVLPPFTVSELFGFLAILYAFWPQKRQIK